MAAQLVIHPLNRGIRPVRIELRTDKGKVISAKAGTTYYWDFDKTLKGKDPLDAIQLTQRFSGIDFVAHSVAAVRALEGIANVTLPKTARLTRNILLALDMVYGNITHFYQYVLPDFVPFQNNSSPSGAAGDRISPDIRRRMADHIWKAFHMRSVIHRMMGIAGGKVPHICNVVFGGVTKKLNIADILKMKSILKEITAFIDSEYTFDFGEIEKTYHDYYSKGKGDVNLLTVGEFPGVKPGEILIPPTVRINGATDRMDINLASVNWSGSWFESIDNGQNSLAVSLKSSPGKAEGYSWVKGVTYDNKTCEVGALARMLLSGNTALEALGAGALSVMGRYRARLEETKMLINNIRGWIEDYEPNVPAALDLGVPKEGAFIGVAEASQGAVIHYVSLHDGRVEKYNVFDSFSWNLCPIISDSSRNTMEQALIGLNTGDHDNPEEVFRVARSF